MSRYALEDVDTKEKKQELFIEGLIDALQCQLKPHDYPSLQHLFGKALGLEDKYKEMVYKKRKSDFLKQARNASQPRLSPPSEVQYKLEPKQHAIKNKGSGQTRLLNTHLKAVRQMPSKRYQKQTDPTPTKACFHCKGVGHYAKECPVKYPRLYVENEEQNQAVSMEGILY
jgi:hypothetical protein